MTDVEDKFRQGHNASLSGFHHAWEQFIDVQPYDRAVYRGYITLLTEMLPIMAEGIRILENPEWVSAVRNFRASHTHNLMNYCKDLWHLRDMLPEHGYENIKRAVLKLKHERSPTVSSTVPRDAR